MSEIEHEQVFVVRVPCFGDPERERDRVLLAVARALHHHVKPGCAVAAAHGIHDGTEQFEIEDLRGGFVTLDPKGDDMGNHDGHDSPLAPRPAPS